MSDTIHIKTHGAQIKSLIGLLSAIVDEAKLNFNEDGLTVAAVDPANVGLVEYTVAADGFNEYTYDTSADRARWGLNIRKFKRAINMVRKGQGIEGGDTVEIELSVNDENHVGRIQVETHRDGMVLTDTFFGINPDSIIQEPTIPNIDENLGVSQELPTQQFRDAMKHLHTRFDHVEFNSVDDGDLGTLMAAGDDDGNEATVSFPECDAEPVNEELLDDDSVHSLYSLEYLEPMAKAIHLGRMEDAWLKYGTDYPCEIQFRQPEWGVTGLYMAAPRIDNEPVADEGETMEVDA